MDILKTTCRNMSRAAHCRRRVVVSILFDIRGQTKSTENVASLNQRFSKKEKTRYEHLLNAHGRTVETLGERLDQAEKLIQACGLWKSYQIALLGLPPVRKSPGEEFKWANGWKDALASEESDGPRMTSAGQESELGQQNDGNVTTCGEYDCSSNSVSDTLHATGDQNALDGDQPEPHQKQRVVEIIIGYFVASLIFTMFTLFL